MAIGIKLAQLQFSTLKRNVKAKIEANYAVRVASSAKNRMSNWWKKTLSKIGLSPSFTKPVSILNQVSSDTSNVMSVLDEMQKNKAKIASVDQKIRVADQAITAGESALPPTREEIDERNELEKTNEKYEKILVAFARTINLQEELGRVSPNVVATLEAMIKADDEINAKTLEEMIREEYIGNNIETLNLVTPTINKQPSQQVQPTSVPTPNTSPEPENVVSPPTAGDGLKKIDDLFASLAKKETLEKDNEELKKRNEELEKDVQTLKEEQQQTTKKSSEQQEIINKLTSQNNAFMDALQKQGQLQKDFEEFKKSYEALGKKVNEKETEIAQARNVIGGIQNYFTKRGVDFTPVMNEALSELTKEGNPPLEPHLEGAQPIETGGMTR